MADPSGTVHLVVTRDTRGILRMSSDDAGRTWRGPVDITSQVMDPAWAWIAHVISEAPET